MVPLWLLVRTNSRTKGLERSWKWRPWLGTDAKNSGLFFLSSHTPFASLCARETLTLLLRNPKPILRKKQLFYSLLLSEMMSIPGTFICWSLPGGAAASFIGYYKVMQGTGRRSKRRLNNSSLPNALYMKNWLYLSHFTTTELEIYHFSLIMTIWYFIDSAQFLTVCKTNVTWN